MSRGQGDDGLAPVAYLPWVRPTADAAWAVPVVGHRDGAGAMADAGPTSGPICDGLDGGGLADDELDGGGLTDDRLADADGENDGSDLGVAPRVPRAGGRAGASAGRRGLRRIDRDPDARAESSSERAEHVSIAALTRRGLSERELGDLLTARGLDEEDVQHELERLSAVGLIDDQALAERLVVALRERKGLGARGIAAELARRGIPPEVAEEALADLDGDEFGAALRIAETRARSLRSLPPEVADRRLAAFLVRKGYSSAVVRRVVRRLLGEGPRVSGVRFD